MACVSCGPVNQMNVIQWIQEYESGTMDAASRGHLFRYLLDTGMIEGLQGNYPRLAAWYRDGTIEGNRT